MNVRQSRSPAPDGPPRRRLALALCVALVLPASAGTPAGGSYALTRQAIAGGGVSSVGASYHLIGTVGQSVTGRITAAGAELRQGVHPMLPAPSDSLFQNGFE